MIKFREYSRDSETPILEVDITSVSDLDYDYIYDFISKGYESSASLINYLDRSKVEEFMKSFAVEYTSLAYHSETTNEILMYQLQALIRACDATDIDWLRYILESFEEFIEDGSMTIDEDAIPRSLAKPITIRMVEFTGEDYTILANYCLA